MMKVFVMIVACLLAVPFAIAGEKKGSACAMHAKHSGGADGSAEHGKQVDARHDTLGMSHQTTRHTFRLFRDGGAIELRANSEDDAVTIAAIRKHIEQIGAAFLKADFTIPAFVHGRKPAGVEGMKKHAAAITYSVEELPRGARIRITTRNREALTAVHEFMRFQIIEHRTGDGGEIEP